MEHVRGEENRKGQPENNFSGGRGKSQAPDGFEGMNYEQKRRPYKEGFSEGEEMGNKGTRNNPGKRRDDQ